jgi:hypothetical protein
MVYILIYDNMQILSINSVDLNPINTWDDICLWRNDCCTTFDITLVQFQQLFFQTIGSVFLHVGSKYPMVDLKKNC